MLGTRLTGSHHAGAQKSQHGAPLQQEVPAGPGSASAVVLDASGAGGTSCTGTVCKGGSSATNAPAGYAKLTAAPHTTLPSQPRLRHHLLFIAGLLPRDALLLRAS